MEESKSDTCVRRCVTFIYAEANRTFQITFDICKFCQLKRRAALKKQNLYNFSKVVIAIVAII